MAIGRDPQQQVTERLQQYWDWNRDEIADAIWAEAVGGERLRGSSNRVRKSTLVHVFEEFGLDVDSRRDVLSLRERMREEHPRLDTDRETRRFVSDEMKEILASLEEGETFGGGSDGD